MSFMLLLYLPLLFFEVLGFTYSISQLDHILNSFVTFSFETSYSHL